MEAQHYTVRKELADRAAKVYTYNNIRIQLRHLLLHLVLGQAVADVLDLVPVGQVGRDAANQQLGAGGRIVDREQAVWLAGGSGGHDGRGARWCRLVVIDGR
jgi:hypothetical protein